MPDETTTQTPESTPQVEAPQAVEEDSHPIPSEDIEALFRFDPFAESAQEPSTAPTPEPPAATEQPSSPTQAAPIAQPATPPAHESAAQLARASELLSDLVRRQVTAPAPTPPAQAPAQPQAQPDDGMPEFNFDLPPEITDALFGEDPQLRLQALRALFRGTARATYRQAREDILKHIQEQVAPRFQQAAAAQAEERHVVSDFYGSFPQLNTPALRALVVEELPSAAQETRSSGWNPQLKQRLYERVVARVQQQAAAFAPQPARQEVPAAPTPAPQAAVRGSGTRPAVGPSSVDEIARTLGLRG